MNEEKATDLVLIQSPGVILGIDPGVNTGVAVFIKGNLSHLETISPGDLDNFISLIKPDRIVFEDSRLQSYTWTSVKSRPAALKMARNIGEIDAWCRLITIICERLSISAHGISPKSKGEKLDAEIFGKVTGWKGKTNQHERDAAMIAWPYRKAHG